MSQRLDSLVKQLIKSDHGSEFIQKTLSPSIDVRGVRVPDEFSEPTSVLDSQRIIQVNPAFMGFDKNLPSGNVRYSIMTLPAFGLHLVVRADFMLGAGSPAAYIKIIADTDPLLTQCVSPGNNTGVKYRTVASSITAHLDATALTNSGTIYATQVNNSYTPGIEGLTGGTTGKGYGSFYWRGSPLTLLNLTDPAFITTRPGCITWDATDGIYAIQRNDGTFSWARADNCNMQSPASNLGITGLITGAPSWEPCVDQDVTVTIFDNIDPSSTVVVKSIRSYEIVPEAGSLLQGLSARSPTDMTAMALYKTMTGQVGTLYPSDFNDWGTLWQGIKNLWAKIKTPVVAGLNFVPGFGGVLSKMASAIPTQTAKEKQQAEARVKRVAQEDRMIREAQKREAQKVMKNKGAAKPKPAARPPAQKKPGRRQLAIEYH